MKNAIVFLSIALMAAGFAFADVKIIDNTAQFEKLIKEAKVPVVMKFSAYW